MMRVGWILPSLSVIFVIWAVFISEKGPRLGFQDPAAYALEGAAGPVIPTVPRQERIRGETWDIHRDEVRIHPHHLFSLDAVVLSRKRYRLGPTGEIAPIDLALGWGPMSDPAVLKKLDISQSGRFYFFRYDPVSLPLPARLLSRNSSNMHMIPADDTIRRMLLKVRRGDVVRIQGKLVDVIFPNGRWESSRTRTDTGNGACEIVLLESIEVIDRDELD